MTVVTARRANLRPTGVRGNYNEILKSVPDEHLRNLIGTTVELEAEEADDWGEPVKTSSRHHITADMVHNELKWRNLL